MKQTNAPATTPSPTLGALASKVLGGKTDDPKSVFFVMALDMSWRLALAVLVPLIGGYEIDKHAHATPTFTILGFIIATIGVVLIMRQTLARTMQLPSEDKEKRS